MKITAALQAKYDKEAEEILSAITQAFQRYDGECIRFGFGVFVFSNHLRRIRYDSSHQERCEIRDEYIAWVRDSRFLK